MFARFVNGYPTIQQMYFYAPCRFTHHSRERCSWVQPLVQLSIAWLDPANSHSNITPWNVRGQVIKLNYEHHYLHSLKQQPRNSTLLISPWWGGNNVFWSGGQSHFVLLCTHMSGITWCYCSPTWELAHAVAPHEPGTGHTTTGPWLQSSKHCPTKSPNWSLECVSPVLNFSGPFTCIC